MWNFIARSYQLLSKGKKLMIPAYIHNAEQQQSNSFFSAPGSPTQPGTGTSAATPSFIMAPSPSASMFDLHGAAANGTDSGLSSDHEKVLVALVKDVLRKYPSL